MWNRLFGRQQPVDPDDAIVWALTRLDALPEPWRLRRARAAVLRARTAAAKAAPRATRHDADATLSRAADHAAHVADAWWSGQVGVAVAEAKGLVVRELAHSLTKAKRLNDQLLEIERRERALAPAERPHCSNGSLAFRVFAERGVETYLSITWPTHVNAELHLALDEGTKED